MAKKKPGRSITLVGAGNLSQALVRLLPNAGYRIDEIVIRPSSSRKSAVAKIARGVGARVTAVENATWSSNVIWLTVSDDAIADCANSVAPRTDWKGKVVLHSSGALSSGELAALRRLGAHVASVHPMMTFVPGRVPNVSGVAWTLEGDPKATAVAREIVRSLGGLSIAIDPKHKSLYHAFGAFLSPLLVIHLEIASQLALASGIERRKLGDVMRPIIDQTMRNFFANLSEEGGSGKAFSGPLIRGDVETIESHLRVLKAFPAALDLYVSLVSGALRSHLPVKKAASIRRAIRKQ
jgi:predicted short-subunit dehydrogenase-like oxidoreductase (DUF2520 family)